MTLACNCLKCQTHIRKAGWDADKTGICARLLELLMGLRDSGLG